MVTKEKEINALKALVEMNGYFAEYFGKDLEKMCGNIRNDFPIELGTDFNAKAETLERLNKETAKETAKKHGAEILDMCDTMLRAHADTGYRDLYDHAVAKLGQKNVIARKRVLGIPVTSEEVDYLLKELGK